MEIEATEAKQGDIYVGLRFFVGLLVYKPDLENPGRVFASVTGRGERRSLRQGIAVITVSRSVLLWIFWCHGFRRRGDRFTQRGIQRHQILLVQRTQR